MEDFTLEFLKSSSRKIAYLGSCVEVGSLEEKYPINSIFEDATEMAYYVGDPDSDDFGRGREIDRKDFFEILEESKVDKRQLEGEVGFYIVPEIRLLYIYNFDSGIHYFYG